jgi:hypothetical protein
MMLLEIKEKVQQRFYGVAFCAILLDEGLQ